MPGHLAQSFYNDTPLHMHLDNYSVLHHGADNDYEMQLYVQDADNGVYSQVTAADYLVDAYDNIEPIYGGIQYRGRRETTLDEAMENFVIYWSSYLYRHNNELPHKLLYEENGLIYPPFPEYPGSDPKFEAIRTSDDFEKYKCDALEQQAAVEAATLMLHQCLMNRGGNVPSRFLETFARHQPRLIVDGSRPPVIRNLHFEQPPPHNYLCIYHFVRGQHVEFICTRPSLFHRLDNWHATNPERMELYEATGEAHPMHPTSPSQWGPLLPEEFKRPAPLYGPASDKATSHSHSSWNPSPIEEASEVLNLPNPELVNSVIYVPKQADFAYAPPSPPSSEESVSKSAKPKHPTSSSSLGLTNMKTHDILNNQVKYHPNEDNKWLAEEFKIIDCRTSSESSSSSGPSISSGCKPAPNSPILDIDKSLAQNPIYWESGEWKLRPPFFPFKGLSEYVSHLFGNHPEFLVRYREDEQNQLRGFGFEWVLINADKGLGKYVLVPADMDIGSDTDEAEYELE